MVRFGAVNQHEQRSPAGLAIGGADSIEIDEGDLRAIARGEIDESTDIGDVIERVVGPLYFRYFLSRRPITKKYLEGLADSVLATLPGASPTIAKRARTSRTL